MDSASSTTYEVIILKVACSFCQQDGYIHVKAMPQMVLAVSQYQVLTSLSHPTLGPTDVRVQGFIVNLQRKTGSMSQQWRFTTDGSIYAQVGKTLNQLI